MKTLKKLLSLLLALALLLGCTAVFAEEAAATEEAAAPVAVPEDSTKENTLIVGSPTLNGDFIDGFGNSAYDNWVKTMLMEYCGTVETNNAGEMVENPMVVAGKEVTTDDAGNRIYTWKIADDLKWSDGSQITAADYVASILWKASPKWLEAGASSSVGYGLLGYNDYLEGKTDVFAGARVIDDTTFSVTIDAAELPYYWKSHTPL